MIKRWILNEPSQEDNNNIDELSKQINTNRVLSTLLVQRGIKTFDEARQFFRPSLDDLHNPFLMNDMDKAIKRLNQALGNKEKILIYGDYDVDGTTSVAMVYSFLRKYTKTIDFYIPDRYDEGYGVSYKGINFAHENGFSLIISLDCGIKAVEKVKFAKTFNIDFIICDHHTPDAVLPDAVAVLDPKREDSTYPYGHLSGCGVGFKLLQAFAMSNGIPESEPMKYLDLLAVSIASDIVPMTGENRILSTFGIDKLFSDPCLGLKTIMDVSGLKDKYKRANDDPEKENTISISDIVFKIGPRINASGRICSGSEAVRLLIATEEEDAITKCNKITDYNDERKCLDKDITEQAIALIENNDELKNRKTTVLYDPEWHKGVIGIVASRLIEQYYRPTVILTKSNGMATGSARSVAGFDLYKAVESCRDILENFGGHMFAAGLTLKEENVPLFKERFEAFVEANIQPDQLQPHIEINAVLKLSEITPRFWKILNQFKPFGPENMKPVFASYRVEDAGGSKLVGKEQGHMKLDLIDDSSYGSFGAIAFSMPGLIETVKAKKPIDICYTVEENVFMGNRNLQLMIRDMKASENELY